MRAVCFIVLLTALRAFAQDAGAVCIEVEQQLSTVQRTLVTCNETVKNTQRLREACEGKLSTTRDALEDSAAQVQACVQQKESQCSQAAALAASLLQGTARSVGSCIPAATQDQVQQLLDGWFGLSKYLPQLDEYVSGNVDQLPRVTGTSEPERHLARILGSRAGSPLWNRRLLMEAYRLTAPAAWARVRAQGAENFFESQGPLPEALVAEAAGDHTEASGPAGTPLSAALRLTVSYLHIARCDLRASSRECLRARQLVELLDNTGPLIIRRRVDEMWNTPCDAINADTIRAWIQALPVTRNEKDLAVQAELLGAARAKLYLCYLADSAGEPAHRDWLAPRLPQPQLLNARTLPLADELQTHVRDGDNLDRCGRAVRELQRLESRGCTLTRADRFSAIAEWAARAKTPGEGALEQTCQRVATLLWSGAAVTVPVSPAATVRTDADAPPTPVALLRKACDERQGTNSAFEHTLLTLANVARDLGEPLSASPWRLDVSGARPAEKARGDVAEEFTAWVSHTLNQESACEALGLSSARCEACREQPPGARYDCDLKHDLDNTWARHRRISTSVAAGLLALVVTALWLVRLRRARKLFGAPMQSIRESLAALGFKASPDPLRYVFPSRHDLLSMELPRRPAWERWGTSAAAVLAPGTGALREADVNHAAAVAQAEDAKVVFLLHADQASPDLGAVRATLDWAARGGTRAVQVLLLPRSRLAWATKDEDLLDLVEATNLRGNPFEVRGPVRSSSQFWNRERLVAGLLTESRNGNWTVVTGLRRFGKSSLALEVARRTTGPSAYVDLAGFHHEVSFGETPGVAVEAILRTLTARLAESANTRFPAATLPPVPTTPLDAPTLAWWLRALSVACGMSSGSSPPPMLLVLDEVEQLLSAPPEKLGRALDVMATLTGRLRSAFADPSSPHASSTVSVVLCAALHPLLWAPLATLGGQSIMGAFPSICVPALDDDASHAMMRGLGARQGIRFEDDALQALVSASHGVPLLLRRLGTSVLELYDADRARQGALGATRIGVEGATEAIRREEKGGSPLRVWVESEIAQAGTSAGVLLRALAGAERLTVAELGRLVELQVVERFRETGLTAMLPPEELSRRAQEAGSVMVRLLAESKLLVAHGDHTSPEAYSLPDGVIRRILVEARRA